MTIDCVLLDLDGVIRHFDPVVAAAAERRHGLAAGVLVETAMAAGDLIDELVTGRLSRAKWVVEVGRRVGSAAAAAEWLADTGEVDPEMLDLADEIRAGGITVAILTNGTDTIPQEVVDLGIADRVDAVFNTAEIGVAKPDAGAFRHVCEALEVEPKSVYFTDDSVAKLAGAVELGMTAEHFVDVDTLRDRLAQLDVLPTR